MNFYTLNRGLTKRLHRYFSYQSTKKAERKEIKSKIVQLNCKPLSSLEKQEIKDFFASYGFYNISTDWHRYYKHLNGKFYREYIPEDLFYNVIEPSLNMRLMFPALTDKNILDKLFQGIRQPKNIVKNINGVYIKADNNDILSFERAVNECNKYQKLVIKPTIESGGGKNVSVLNIQSGITDQENLTIDLVLKNYNKNFIVQECLEQHAVMNLLNKSSINTLRIKTILIEEEIIILNSVVRIGVKGSRVDNMSRGGHIFKIMDDGKLSDRGFFGSGLEIRKKDLNFDTEKFEIPNYQNVLSVVKSLHKQILHFKLISWDIAIDPDGNPILIEFNIFGQGIGQEYKTLFGEYTGEILKSCKINLFSF